MTRCCWLFRFGLTVVPFVACGPDHRPEPPCEGPSFNLVITAEMGQTLPADTRITVRYGGNPDGEPYVLGKPRTPQAVSCTEDLGGASAVDDTAQNDQGGAGGAPSASSGVFALRCGLYTQGAARLDVSATGYEPIVDKALSFEHKPHCEVPMDVQLVRLKPDAGM